MSNRIGLRAVMVDTDVSVRDWRSLALEGELGIAVPHDGRVFRLPPNRETVIVAWCPNRLRTQCNYECPARPRHRVLSPINTWMRGCLPWSADDVAVAVQDHLDVTKLIRPQLIAGAAYVHSLD